MGCTLIPIGVLIKTLPFVKTWRCNNPACETRWETERWEAGDCPDCGTKLLPDWFKTIRDFDDDGHTPAIFTEDAYFCRMVTEAGMKVYADAGVQCRHEKWDPDPEKVTHYYYHPGVGPAWEQNGQTLFYPDAGHECHEKMQLSKPSKNGAAKFNLGSGVIHKKGYVNIDLKAKCDFRCDCRDISPAVREYGQAKEINASHLLEHIFRGDAVKSVRSWLKALEPGGTLHIEVPDGVWAAKNYIKHHESKARANDFPDMVVMGAQRYPGDEHKTLISEKRINEIIRACKNQIAEYKVWALTPKGFNQRVIRVRIKKKAKAK
jgi:predicted SAM-dependent methyltransferase